MRGSTAGVRQCVFQAALTALLALASVATSHAAVFDDGNDRKFVKNLREKDPANLTDEEKAILVAANNVGIVRLCDGRSGGNAFLIRYGGRPAVLTSGHMLVDTGTGSFYCGEAQATRAFYYPDASYYDPEAKDKKIALRRIDLVWPPIGLVGVLGRTFKMDSDTDWLVFLLEADVVQDIMPDGSVRGALANSSEQSSSGELILIGVAPDVEKSNRALYQVGCDYKVVENFIHHNCDTVRGSSGSLLGVYEAGEIRIRGVHNFARMGNETLPRAMTRIDAVWNGGVPIETILANANKPLPEFLAYDIQLWLSRAGCYSGKLDNQWGPASRKALAAFAAAVETELPGIEPRPELLAAVEKAAPEGPGVCRR